MPAEELARLCRPAQILDFIVSSLHWHKPGVIQSILLKHHIYEAGSESSPFSEYCKLMQQAYSRYSLLPFLFCSGQTGLFSRSYTIPCFSPCPILHSLCLVAKPQLTWVWAWLVSHLPNRSMAFGLVTGQFYQLCPYNYASIDKPVWLQSYTSLCRHTFQFS